MELVSDAGDRMAAAAVPVHGLAGWLLELGARVVGRGRARVSRRKELQIVEVLTIGAKKQVVLVRGGGERFLVGTGADSVGTIVRVGADAGVELANAEDFR